MNHKDVVASGSFPVDVYPISAVDSRFTLKHPSMYVAGAHAWRVAFAPVPPISQLATLSQLVRAKATSQTE